MLSSIGHSWVSIGRSLVNVRLIYKQPKYEFSVQYSSKGTVAIEAVGTNPQRLQMNVAVSDLEAMKNAFIQLDSYAKAFFVFDVLTHYLSHSNIHSVVKVRQIIYILIYDSTYNVNKTSFNSPFKNSILQWQ